MSSATVFDIRELTLHDGSGVRVTVFLKGCPLSCVWCHNPEGKKKEPELMIKKSLCKGCMLCRSGESETFRKFGRNAEACPDGLISVCGKEMSADELVSKIKPLADMLRMMDGGVTFSGGEPLVYPEFVTECARKLRTLGLSVAVETSGYADAETFCKVISACDFVMMDIKILSSELHKKYTGASNEKILQNAKLLSESGKNYEFRTPVIKGYTDGEDNLAAIEAFARSLGAKWVKLPENPLARAKDGMLGY